MEEEGTEGDQTPLYSQFYDNPQLQQQLNHNVNVYEQQQQNQNVNVDQQQEDQNVNAHRQQQLAIAPFNGESYNNGTVPFNGESYINGTAPFNAEIYNNGTVPFNWGSYINGTVTFNGESYNNGTAPLNGESYNNGTAPFNDESSSNETAPFNGESYNNGTAPFNGEIYNNGTAPYNGENCNFVTRPFNVESHINGDNYNNGLRHPLQPQSLPSSSHARLTFSSSRHNIILNNNNINHYLYPQPQIQTLQQAQFQNLQQAQFQTLQQTQLQRQIQQPPPPPSMEMQFQQRQNMEIEIQHMDQSKNVNVNVVSQPMEIVMASLPAPPLNGGKRKRGRPRKSCKPADNGDSTPPLGFAKMPQGLQSEHGGSAVFRIIVVAPGEDVQEKIMSFYQQTPLTVCIISAKGTISNVDFQEIMSGRIVNHKGEFDILSLSCSYTMHNSYLHGILVHSDGKIFWGRVGGLLMAASYVEVVVGVFPEQVRNKGPHMVNVQAFTAEIPISILGQPNTEV